MTNFLKQDLEQALSDMEQLAKLIGFEPFDVYLLGGSGCVLGGYLERATRDIDVVDLDYKASLGRVFKLLEPCDMIDLRLAAIPPSFRARAVRLEQYEFLRVYVLSREDIIISKLTRYNLRDRDDISILWNMSSLSLIFALAKEVLLTDLLLSAKEAFLHNFARCLEENHVPDYMQQLEELRKGFQ